jgi:sucrose phosphorylase
MKLVADDYRNLFDRIIDHLNVIYNDADNIDLARQIIEIMSFDDSTEAVPAHRNLWDEDDVIAITYGNSITRDDEIPLKTLHHFFNRHFAELINIVHILPFYPYSSDDGFSVINYVEVNQSLGDWKDINAIAGDYRLMADLVINHCSSRSLWFDNYKQGKQPGTGYFIETDPETDLSDVVRPRTSPLLRETETIAGKSHVWCTFSHDQVDLNFANPDVLLEFVRIIRFYLDNGISLFRLDAVAFLWKEIGTACINLPQTHEVIRLIRLLVEHFNPEAVIITETNIPNRENLSYFGNANEAHWIYNFTLPPLVLYTMFSGRCHLLKQWMMSMPPAQNGTAYFNFIASHDGIGLRPVEGILSAEEVDAMADTVRELGGEVSWRTMADGSHRPYELNISLIDAMSGTFDGPDELGLERFICAHAIMLALEGVPAFYIHSLLGTRNDHEKKELSGHNRAINRHVWQSDRLEQELANPRSEHRHVLDRLSALIRLRRQQKAFHPNATMFTMHFGESVFAFWRQSQDRRQSVFCLYNITREVQDIRLQDVNLSETYEWADLVSGHRLGDLRGTLRLQPYEFVWISG